MSNNSKPYPKLYFILYNISKRGNVKDLVLAAKLFGVYEIVSVGKRKDDPALFQGVRFHHEDKLEQCVNYLKDKDVTIYGVEIMEGAFDIESYVFTGDSAIMMGNEGSGLNDKQIKYCDHFLYIAQYGTGTASLNVTVAASIILHRFALWAQYPGAGSTYSGDIDSSEQRVSIGSQDRAEFI